MNMNENLKAAGTDQSAAGFETFKRKQLKAQYVSTFLIALN